MSVFTACILMLCMLPIAQDKPPSLEETTEWIQSTCDVHADRQQITFDNCSVSAFWRQPEDRFFLWFATLPLKDVEFVGTTQDADKWRIRLKTIGKFPAHMSRRTGPAQSVNQFDLLVSDKQIAERLKTAMLHAVAICKKQKEPF